LLFDIVDWKGDVDGGLVIIIYIFRHVSLVFGPVEISNYPAFRSWIGQ